MALSICRGGYQASGALISRLVSDGRAGAAYMRIPAAGAASVAFFVLGKELAGPATTLGLKIGKTITYGLDGLQADVFGRAEGSLPAWEADARWTDLIFGRGGGTPPSATAAKVPAEPLQMTKDRLREIEVARGGIRSAAEGERISPEEAAARLSAAAAEEAAAGKDDAELRELTGMLCGLRAEKASLVKALKLVGDTGAEGAAAFEGRKTVVEAAMKDLKAKAMADHGVRLAKLVSEEITGRAKQLEYLRVEQLRVRGLLEERAGAAERARLRGEEARIEAAKKKLKSYVAAHYGEKLSSKAKSVPKRPS